MTDIINGIPVIYEEPPQKCGYCGKTAETRPYGKGGKEICFDCMTTIPEAEVEATRRFKNLLEGKKDKSKIENETAFKI